MCKITVIPKVLNLVLKMKSMAPQSEGTMFSDKSTQKTICKFTPKKWDDEDSNCGRKSTACLGSRNFAEAGGSLGEGARLDVHSEGVVGRWDEVFNESVDVGGVKIGEEVAAD